MKYRLICDTCSSIFPPASGLYTCPRCRSRLRVEYVDQGIDFSRDGSLLGIFRFISKLPLHGGPFVTLGEGATPVILLEGETSGGGEFWVKNESLNPTGTYKDRPAAVSVSKARELGAKGVVVASDGNAAPAVAAYAAKANLHYLVLMPRETPELRYLQAKAYGAEIFLVDGTINDCLDMAVRIAEATEYHNCCTSNAVNPYQVEGNKTIAFEIAEQFIDIPDWVAVPVGGGGLLSAVVKGFEELMKGKAIDRMPRVLAVQAKNCAPLVDAFEKNTAVTKLENPGKTVALTIALSYPPDGDMALGYLKKCKGIAVAVTEEEIMQGVFNLSEKHGILAEPSGAVSFAGLKRAVSRDIIKKGEKCVAVVTGTGLKSIDVFREGGGNINEVSKDTSEILSYLRSC